MTSHSSSRRTFIKTFMLGIVSSGIPGQPWTAPVLAEKVERLQSPAANVGLMKITLSQYPPLLQPYGSVRLSVNPVTQDQQPYPEGPFYPVIITRGENNDFHVLDSRCTHASCVVDAFNPNFDGCRCRCHGSLFSYTGSVLAGPARDPLAPLRFEWDQADSLAIEIVGLNYDVVTTVVNTHAGSRVRLQFPAFYNSQYEVHFRARLRDPWTLIPFSTSPDGEAEQTVINGFGEPLTLYANRVGPVGFYGVAIRVLET